MKAVQQAVTVTVEPSGHLRVLHWQGRVHHISAVMDQWRSEGRWWLGERPRSCYLVQAGELVAELHHEDAGTDRGGGWWLARIQD
ncbi:Nucleotidyltransferase [Deinococcus saxicola]|uniref:DUF6504 family protein n=1 Tax=Deinococcus saxicola TaxID=249406 RepID=UPI0039EF1B14